MTIVACSRRAPGARNIYYTGIPGGQYNTRTWVTEIPNAEGLTGLAGFLAAHVGNTSNHRGALRVRAYNDNTTEAEMLRAQAAEKHTVNGCHYSGTGAAERAISSAENTIIAYDLENKAPVIQDWLFPVWEPGQDAATFWTLAAAQMIAAGVTRVCVSEPLRGPVEYVV